MPIVMKFGGTSVGSAEIIKSLTNIVKSHLGRKPVVVLSAVSGITNMLVKICENLSNEAEANNIISEIRKKHDEIISGLGIRKDIIDDVFNEFVNAVHSNKKSSPEAVDLISSFGERFSVRMVAEYMNKFGINANSFDAWDIGMITNDDFGNAEPLAIAEKKMQEIKKSKEIVVTTGFIGKTLNGRVATLGRGGSDYTAAIIGAAIDADEIQIWTDVNGIMSSDPKVVKSAKTVPEMSFEEAAELAYFGARVLHPKTILPAIRKGIPVRVLNTFNPSDRGTVILKHSSSRMLIKGIASKKNITIINIESTRMLNSFGFLARAFEVFRAHRKSVDLVSTSEVSISLTVDNPNGIDNVVNELKEIADVSFEGGKAILCVVGSGMKHVAGISGRTFKVLGDNGINIEMISQGASEINISFVVRNEDADKAVRLLHQEYFEG